MAKLGKVTFSVGAGNCGIFGQEGNMTKSVFWETNLAIEQGKEMLEGDSIHKLNRK